MWCYVLSESAKDFEYDGLFICWFVDLPTGNWLTAFAYPITEFCSNIVFDLQPGLLKLPSCRVFKHYFMAISVVLNMLSPFSILRMTVQGRMLTVDSF